MYPIETPEEQALYFHELRPVVNYIDRHFNENITMTEMASMAGHSSTQFNYRFRAILRMSPTEYLLSRRIEYAQRLLAEASMTIAKVSANQFSVALIPTTLERTNLGKLKVGDHVNIGTDILARTILHQLKTGFSDRGSEGLFDQMQRPGYT